jgi:hypothetical protein
VTRDRRSPAVQKLSRPRSFLRRSKMAPLKSLKSLMRRFVRWLPAVVCGGYLKPAEILVRRWGWVCPPYPLYAGVLLEGHACETSDPYSLPQQNLNSARNATSKSNPLNGRPSIQI